jgi:dihydrofolate reductase
MPKVNVAAFSVSLDGFGAGPRQDLQNPIGVRGLKMHDWFFQTEVFQKMTGQSSWIREMEAFKMIGQSGGAPGIDNDFAAASFENVGAYIMGRNVFGPVRGPWKDDSWKGWWGANPPFHTPVFWSRQSIIRAIQPISMTPATGVFLRHHPARLSRAGPGAGCENTTSESPIIEEPCITSLERPSSQGIIRRK